MTISRLRGRPVVVAVLVGPIVMCAALPAGAASPPPAVVTGTPSAPGAGYNGAYQGMFAGSQGLVVPGSATVQVFCVNEPAVADPNIPISSVSWAASGVANVARAASIAVDGTHVGTPLADPNGEATAEQFAIWKYTNNINYSSSANSATRARADYLVAHAGYGLEGPSSFVLSATVTHLTHTTGQVQASVTTSAGAPLAGRAVTFTRANGTTHVVNTNSAGIATDAVSLPAKAGLEQVVLHAVLDAGSVLTAPSTQPRITAAPIAITRSTSVVIPAVVLASASKPASAPSKAPAPTALAHTLPFTGTDTAPWMVLLAMLGAGVGVGVVVALKR